MNWLLKLVKLFFNAQTPSAPKPDLPVGSSIPGAIDDYRTDEEKAKDYEFKEIVASFAPVNWTEKSVDQWRRFPTRDQDGSGSCVAQTMAKMLGILSTLNNDEFIEFSASYIYQRRQNKTWGNGEGMWGTDAFEIVRKNGATLEVLMPSQSLNEREINRVPESERDGMVAEVYKLGNYVSYRPKLDFEAIASTIQHTGKPVMVWFMFNYSEWTDVPVVQTTNPTLHHSVTAVDVTLYQGKKALIIEDSWGEDYGLEGRRVITEDFFKARNTFAAYPINFKTSADPSTQPTVEYTFGVTLRLGDTSPDLVALQNALKYEGLFPTNVGSSGYYGNITAKAVLAFQKKHNVASDSELDALAGRIVGPKTIAKLNELYSR
jgi:hypothetical protein